MTGLRAYREEEELGEGPAIPHSRPHYGEDRSQRFPLPRAAAAGSKVDSGLALWAVSHTSVPEKLQVCGAQWDLASRCEGGVSWGEWTQLIPIPSFLCPSLPGFSVGPLLQGQRLWKGVS